MDKIIDKNVHFRTSTKQVTFFFLLSPAKNVNIASHQTHWKIIYPGYSYWEEAIFQVSERESKNLMSLEK
jgi:hypothetical protein